MCLMMYCLYITLEPEDTTHVALVVGVVGGVFLVTLLIGIYWSCCCLYQTVETKVEYVYHQKCYFL